MQPLLGVVKFYDDKGRLFDQQLFLGGARRVDSRQAEGIVTIAAAHVIGEGGVILAIADGVPRVLRISDRASINFIVPYE